MSFRETYVLQCEDGYKVTITVWNDDTAIRFLLDPIVIDTEHEEVYCEWYRDSVAPELKKLMRNMLDNSVQDNDNSKNDPST